MDMNGSIHSTHVSIQSMANPFMIADEKIKMQSNIKYVNPQYQFTNPQQLLKSA